eukprot:scaffold2570_cov223-Alexandrium_tamarense.AAC.3
MVGDGREGCGRWLFGGKHGNIWTKVWLERRIQNASIEDHSSFVSSHSIAQHSGGVGKPATGADNTIKEESFSGQS